VVYNDLVAAVRAQRGLHRLGNCAASVDVAYDGAIFGVVAVVGWLGMFTRGNSWLLGPVLLVALLKEPGVRGVGYCERHGGCVGGVSRACGMPGSFASRS
jgi:hypothetical protein